jgi:hypothetical protein
MSRRRSVTVAVVLWLVLAFLVWNDVFDRVIVLAGRRYAHDATVLYRSTGQYLRIDDVMRPAIAHGVRLATAAAGGIAGVALVAIRVAARREAARNRMSGNHQITKSPHHPISKSPDR